MNEQKDQQPTYFTIHRASEPKRIEEAGEQNLSQLLYVAPSPEPNPELLRTVCLRHEIILREVNKDDNGATYEAVSKTGQSVESLQHLEIFATEFEIFVNAVHHPDKYTQLLHPGTGPNM